MAFAWIFDFSYSGQIAIRYEDDIDHHRFSKTCDGKDVQDVHWG
jgi:hypothetical protein